MKSKIHEHLEKIITVVSKKTHLFIGLSMMLAAACSKSDKGAGPSGNLTTIISTQMAKTDSLGSFNKYFKAGTLSDAEVSGGITVFAPSNNAFGNASVTGSGQLPDSSVLKDYIVKGVLKASDLTNGKTLTTLSGKTLTVSVVADPIILVGGMIISTDPISSGDNYVVYGAAQLLNAPAPIFITVWDATKWSSSKPKGERSAGTTVSLYKSQEAFANNLDPDYSGVTDADGVAQINGVKPGSYYVAAVKGAYSNIYSVYFEKTDGVYLGYAADTVLDNAGKLVWKDLNMDGKVDKNDQGGQPALNIQTVKNKPLDIPVLIGYLYKPLTTAAEVQAELDGVYSGLSNFYKNLVIMDGTLSDEADCGSDASYCSLDNFTMLPNTAVFNSIWTDAYFKGIHKLNDVIRNTSFADMPAEQASDLANQAYALQDYIYLELATYFGDIPFSTQDVSSDFWPGITRSAVTDIYGNLINDLAYRADYLPATRPDGKAGITSHVARALLAKVTLQKKDYNKVLTYTSRIIDSKAFSLAPMGFSFFTSQNTNETIWAPAFSNIGTSAAWYFSGKFGGTALQWCPVLRYADVLLMDAEAKIATADYDGAAQNINAIRAKYSEAPVSFTTEADGYSWLLATWGTEKYSQGDRYACLVRWGKAQSMLAAKGWQPTHNLMPVPLNLINIYPNLVQNPGY